MKSEHGVNQGGDRREAARMLASVPNALIMETYPGVEHQYNPALPLYPVINGHIGPPDRPGLGIDPDSELVRTCQIKRS